MVATNILLWSHKKAAKESITKYELWELHTNEATGYFPDETYIITLLNEILVDKNLMYKKFISHAI